VHRLTHRSIRERALLSHLPRSTVRLRLSSLYGGLFLVSGAVLLAITYVLVVHATSAVIFHSEGSSVGVGGAVVNPVSPPGGATLIGPDLVPPPDQAGALPGDAAQLQAQASAQHAVELHQLLLQSAIALGVMAVISMALGWLVAGRVLRPLRTITTAVREISATNLHRRLALDGPDDELKELGNAFDELVSRLEAAFQAQRRFVANASHELRTPLARQRTLGQVALTDPNATVDSLRAAHERIIAAGVEQEQLIEALLTLARGQAGIDRHEFFDLGSVTDDVVQSLEADAGRRGVALNSTLGSAPVTGNPRLVVRLVTNLVDNALRHNLVGGKVDVSTHIADGRGVFSVSNTGPKVTADAVARLFQPFRRIDTDRTVRGEGLGLGLSIVQAIADAHGAGITTRPGVDGGLHVEIAFPLALAPEKAQLTMRKPALAVTAAKPLQP
jgi:signal transduction histidine kinase